MIKTQGLILKEQSVGESDKLVTVLTRSNGVIRCFCKRAKKLISNVSSACQVMTYSRLGIFEGRDQYIITEAEVIKSFFDAFDSIEGLELGYYLSELAINMIPENMPSEDYLQLLLNCLHAIAGNLRPLPVIKAVFELRIMLLGGVLPDVLFCCECGRYDTDTGTMHYAPIENKLYCPSCCYKEGMAHRCITVSMASISAVRYCITAEPKKILSFQLSGRAVRDFSVLAERFILAQNDFYCRTLDFYKNTTEELK